MDFDFKNFLNAKGLSQGTQEQYTLYFNKLDVLYINGMLNQESINEFIATYKSNLVKSFVRIYLEYRNIRDLNVSRRTGRLSRKKPLIMSKEDNELLLKVLYDYNMKIGLMTDLSYSCALRRNEVCNIEVRDINWKHWMDERKSGVLLIRKAKGDKQRYVLIPNELMLKLKEYINSIQVTPSNKLFFKDEKNKDLPIPVSRYWKTYHKAVKMLFGSGYKLHTLRHTKATEWFEKGVDIVRIQQRLGHSDISTTRLYINPDEKSELLKWKKELDDDI